MVKNSYRVDIESSVNLQITDESVKKMILKRSWKLILAIIIPIALSPLVFVNPQRVSLTHFTRNHFVNLL